MDAIEVSQRPGRPRSTPCLPGDRSIQQPRASNTSTEETARAAFSLSAPATSRRQKRSDVEAVHDPAHAWNALSVCAFTEKANLGEGWDGWSPIAAPGDLSPWSTTSVSFRYVWPIKPDVVFEGGNVAHDGNGNLEDGVGDLCLLSTHYQPANRLSFLPGPRVHRRLKSHG
jgi:subtilase family protein